MLRSFSKDTERWSDSALKARKDMMALDPDYPIYHLVPWKVGSTIPTGSCMIYPLVCIIDSISMIRRVRDCMHGNVKNCSGISADGGNRNAKLGPYSIEKSCRTLVRMARYPLILLWSSRCIFVIVCFEIRQGRCRLYLLRRSDFSVRYRCLCAINRLDSLEQNGLYDKGPSVLSQTNHDSSIFNLSERDVLPSECDVRTAITVPTTTADKGNGRTLSSDDSATWTYTKALTSGGPGPAGNYLICFLSE